MFHKHKSEIDTQEQTGQSGQDQASGELAIDSDDNQQTTDQDNMTQNSSNSQSAEQGEQQQQAGKSQDGQAKQTDIPASGNAYRGSQQIPNAERMQQPGHVAAAPYAAAAAQHQASTQQGQESAAGDEDTAKGRRLVVGQGITMSGEIEACDHLVVEGTVEAALKGASVLEISETGVFYGAVEIDEAVVAGRFEGELSVNGRLSVRSTGSITGTIAYKELAVEAGAVLDGKISPMKGEQDQRTHAAKNEKKDSTAKKTGTQAEDKEGSDNELPLSGETKKDSTAA